MDRRWIIFGICVSLFLMSMLYRASTAIIAQDLANDLRLNPQDLGLLGAVFFYTFALVQLPLGPLLDRVGARATMIVLNMIGVMGTIIFANAGGLMAGVTGRGLMGLGMAANLMGTLKLLTHWFDLSKFATLSGLILSLGTLGSLAATSPMALLVQSLGWRTSFYVLGGLNTLLLISLFLFARESPEDRHNRGSIPPADSAFSVSASVKRLFLSWNYWAISMSVFLRYGSFASIQALWIGPFLMQSMGLPAITAGNLMLVISFGYILGSPVGGILSDKVFKSRKRALILALTISSLATFALALWYSSSHLYLLGIILLFFGFFSSFTHISYAHIRELMPEEMSGTAMAGINFFTMAGAGLFIHGLGGVIKHMSPNLLGKGHAYATAFLICCAALIMSLLLYTTTKDSAPP